MSFTAEYLKAFEVHSPEGLRAALAAGASATELINGKTPIEFLIEGYLRSPRFVECLRVLLEASAKFSDPLLEALMLDDDEKLRSLLNSSSAQVTRKLSAPCAFTLCEGVTALHLCAEFNCIRCARVLLEVGADVNARAEFDAEGFGGQTPVFHAANSIFNYCRPMLELLVEAGADLDIKLKGLVWGKGADWETLVLEVTPISYAQCGLYAQFHRREHDVYDNLTYLYEKKHGTQLRVRNVPNKYLSPKA